MRHFLPNIYVFRIFWKLVFSDFYVHKSRHQFPLHVTSNNIQICLQSTLHKNEMKKQHIPYCLFWQMMQLLKVQKIIKIMKRSSFFRELGLD